MDEKLLRGLELDALECRRNVLRMIRAGGSGHMGGALSCMDIVTALYFYKMNIDPAQPKMPERDRFLLSAGHKATAQYAALCRRGFFPEEELDTYGGMHTHLPGHPDMYKLPGVEANTGALGHGLSIACGMALGLRMDGFSSRVYTVMGDGELPEGSNWEAAGVAAQYALDNLTVFVDANGLQIAGRTDDVMKMEPIEAHFEAYGWAARRINGNSMAEIVSALDALPFVPGKPSVIVADTTKAKGIPWAEGNAAYHHWKPSAEELERAFTVIDAAIAAKKEELEA